jgi:hypothetical protein
MEVTKLDRATKLIHYVSMEYFFDWLANGLFLPDLSHFQQSELNRLGDVESNLFFKSFMIDAKPDLSDCRSFVGNGRDAVIIETTLQALHLWLGETIETDRGTGRCTYGQMKYYTEKSEQENVVGKMSPVEKIMWLPESFSVEDEYRVVIQIPEIDNEESDHIYVLKGLLGLFHTAYVHPNSKTDEVQQNLLDSGLTEVKVLAANFGKTK